MLRAGTATATITPQRPWYMQGYGNRMGKATGTLDPLEARVIALDDGTTSAAIDSVDLLGLDAASVARVLDYLLDNAVKVTEEGEVVLSVKPQGDQVIFRVRDTGVGIGAKFLPQLFAAFTQESTGLTRSHEGVGIGLTVAQRLTELLGGSISVESEKGKGSVFAVRFPATPSTAQRKATRLVRRKRNTSGNITT